MAVSSCLTEGSGFMRQLLVDVYLIDQCGAPKRKAPEFTF